MPGNNVAVVLEGRYRGVPLRIVRRCIDPVLATKWISEDIKVLGVDITRITVLVIPSDDEVAAAVTGHFWVQLVTVNVGVDLELAGLGNRNHQLGAVAEAKRFDIKQGVGAFVALGKVKITHRHRRQIDGVVGSVA